MSRKCRLPLRFGRGLECLEHRTMLTLGLAVITDVQVEVTAGDLVVTGDNGANSIEIRQIAPNGYELSGVPQPGIHTYLKVNGHRYPSVRVYGITDDFRLTMQGGDDFVTLHGPTVGYLGVPDVLTILTGDGNDRVHLIDVHARGNLTVDTGNHDDFVRAVQLLVGAAGAAANAMIQTRNGSDTVQMVNSEILGDLTINAGTDAGADCLELNRVETDRSLLLRTYGGADSIVTDQMWIDERLTVDTGADDDHVALKSTNAEELYATLGAGNDVAELKWVYANDTTVLGGSGTLDEYDEYDCELGSLVLSGFEA